MSVAGGYALQAAAASAAPVPDTAQRSHHHHSKSLPYLQSASDSVTTGLKDQNVGNSQNARTELQSHQQVQKNQQQRQQQLSNSTTIQFPNVARTTSELLERYKNYEPSLILHLYPNHFRFEQQDGVFTFDSPMRMILESLRNETIPPDVVEVFLAAKVAFYEGCLIVQVRDYRTRQLLPSSSSQWMNRRPMITSAEVTRSRQVPKSSVVNGVSCNDSDPSKPSQENENRMKGGANHSDVTMPHSAVPTLKPQDPPLRHGHDVNQEKGQNHVGNQLKQDHEKPEQKLQERQHVDHTGNHKESGVKVQRRDSIQTSVHDARDQQQQQQPQKVYRTVLKPTAETLWQDLCLYAESMLGRLGDTKALQIESEILLATQKPLHLEPAYTSAQAQHIIDSVSDRPPAGLLKRKRRDTSTLVAQEARRAEDERYFLMMDELHNRQAKVNFSKLSFIEQVRRKNLQAKKQQQQQQQQKRAQNEDTSRGTEKPQQPIQQNSQLQMQQQAKIQRAKIIAAATMTGYNSPQDSRQRPQIQGQQMLMYAQSLAQEQNQKQQQQARQEVKSANKALPGYGSAAGPLQRMFTPGFAEEKASILQPNARSHTGNAITGMADNAENGVTAYSPPAATSTSVSAAPAAAFSPRNWPINGYSMPAGNAAGSPHMPGSAMNIDGGTEKQKVDIRIVKQQAIYLHHYASSLKKQGLSPQAIQESVLKHAKEKGMNIQMVAALLRNLQ